MGLPDPRPVPPPPYFHGKQRQLQPGDVLGTGTVFPPNGDHRLMCWATNSLEWTMRWAWEATHARSHTPRLRGRTPGS